MLNENSSRSDAGSVLVLGIYLSDQLNNVEEIVRNFNASNNWHVRQKWIAIGKEAVSEAVQNATSQRLQKCLPKFVLLNKMLAHEDLAKYDFIIFCDDDITMRDGFLDDYLGYVVKYDFALAQPARTPDSYIDHYIVKQVAGLQARRTRFVEIGPLFSVRRDIFPYFFPFAESSPMGWGYDFVWPCLIESLRLRMGIVDATPVEHSLRKPVKNYNLDEACKTRNNYLSENRHLSRSKAFSMLEAYGYLKLADQLKLKGRNLAFGRFENVTGRILNIARLFRKR